MTKDEKIEQLYEWIADEKETVEIQRREICELKLEIAKLKNKLKAIADIKAIVDKF